MGRLTGACLGRRLRAIVCSGQAVVLHRVAIMSKDGDWILREDEGALQQIRSVLAGRGAHYRFGAPLDLRWMRGGWSSHFEFRSESLRVRTDFVTRPPRLTREAWPRVEAEIKGLSLEQAHSLVVTRAEKILPFAPAAEAKP